MVLRVLLIAVMAIGIIGFGTVVWLGMRPAPTQEAAAPAPPSKIAVLVAAGSLHAGALLKPEDIANTEVRVTDVPTGARTDSPQGRSELFGAMVRHSMGQGQVILPADILRPGDHGFLAAVLQPGMRALTVAVDIVSGTAGLIWPGDHVDVLLTQTLDDVNLPPGRRISGETTLHNVRVIAIDQQLIQGASPNGAEPQAARTVTLEVAPDDATRLAVATRLGHLSLVVRAAEPKTASESDSTPSDAGEMSNTATTATAVAVQHPAVAQAGTQAAAAASAPAAALPVPASTQRMMATAAPLGGPEQPGITWGGDVSPALNAGRHTPSGAVTLHVFEGASDDKEFHF